jgi:hypothetical protein
MIQAKENTLFERWKRDREYASFDKDGVVNPELWEKTSPKIVFVLRETNGLNGDLRKFLRKGGRGPTWNTVVRWAEVILFNTYSDKVDHDQRKKILPLICVFNLKKESGGASSKPKAIRVAAEKDRDFIQEQLNLYQPDIVIACGLGREPTASLLMKDIYEDSDSNCPNNVNELNYYRTEKINQNKPICVISMPHPNRAKKHESTHLLCDLYNALKSPAK